LPQTQRGGLEHRLIGQGARAGNDSTLPGW
jgi:hypothetical protein